MTLWEFLLQLIPMLILTGAATFAVLLGAFHLVDRWGR